MNSGNGLQRERSLKWLGKDRIIPPGVDPQKRFVGTASLCQ
jgi:hypothetical protein